MPNASKYLLLADLKLIKAVFIFLTFLHSTKCDEKFYEMKSVLNVYRNINATADADTLQDDIDRLQKWEADWLMEFNPDKCEIIRITNRRKKKVVSCYSIHGKALKEVTGAKYLGATSAAAPKPSNRGVTRPL